MILGPHMSQRLNRAGRTTSLAAALAGSLAAACGALADPAAPPEPTDQQRADKETELRGVEDTLRESEEQRRAIEG